MLQPDGHQRSLCWRERRNDDRCVPFPLCFPILTTHYIFQQVDRFVRELARTETDKQKSKKLDELELSEGKWKSIEKLITLLEVQCIAHRTYI